MRTTIKVLSLLIVIGLVALGIDAFRFLSVGPGLSSEEETVEISPGSSFQQIAKLLKSKGLILDELRFRVLAKLTGQDHLMKRGEYALNKAMSPQQVLNVLSSGKSIQRPITFPEGSNIFEMSELVEKKGFFKAADFLQACRDRNLIRDLLGVEVSSLEGYLYPETYQLTKFTSLKELITSMVNNFKTAYSAVEAQGGGNPLSLARHELVTLASIVEKETGAREERPLIASVFYNRLNKAMKLQSDPTIIYGLWTETGRYKENITKEDILRPTRYNTYTVARLPFGPIANPGKEALQAVFRPVTSDYLFFVSRNDGTHVFTRSYEDHLKAVQSFQLNPEARQGKSWRDLNGSNAKAAKK